MFSLYVQVEHIIIFRFVIALLAFIHGRILQIILIPFIKSKFMFSLHVKVKDTNIFKFVSALLAFMHVR